MNDPAPTRVLVDSIDFGVLESEQTHPGSGSFSNRYGHQTTDYAGPANRPGPPAPGAPGHWRDFANWASVGLRAGERWDGRELTLALLVRTYRTGDPPAPPAPLVVTFESDSGPVPLGTIDLPDDGRWHRAELPVPADGRGRELVVRFDDGANLHADEHHYGKSLAFVRLYGQEG